MAGESILIIDDTPVSLKLTRVLLTSEGFDVRTVPDAEQALVMLDSFRPALILVDIQLPGMDGLEFTRRVKADPRWQDVVVVALTAFAASGNEARAMNAGCDGYITKPIDSKTLLGRVRECVAMRNQPGGNPAPATPPDAESATVSAPVLSDPYGLPSGELEELRRNFLDQATRQSREMLDSLDSDLDPAEACKLMHQWVGSAGILEYNEVSSIARELEQLFEQRPLDGAQARGLLDRMVGALSQPQEKGARSIPAAIAGGLGGRQVALVGFTQLAGERVCEQLSRAGAVPRLFPAAEPPDSDGIRSCHVVMIQVGAETLSSVWLDGNAAAVSGKPTVLLGDRETLMGLDSAVQERASEFLFDPWQPEDAMARASRVLMRSDPGARPAPRFPAASTRPVVLVADDDPTVLSIVRSTLQNHGMDVRTAANGIEALEQFRAGVPDAAILDINMPGMDGFELLTRIRAEKLAVHVILLTARQQQSDLWQGFNLGAHDYVVKPFSPMELVARVKRLLVLSK